jgi:carboxymethylenebutenolidase
MCFPYDAIPPEVPYALRAHPPLAGAAPGERLELTSEDGTRFSAYLAPAAEPGPSGVVVLPDVRGLFRFYETLAERFAEAGHSAIAMDYFGRTAGLGPRDEDFEYMPHVMETRPASVATDVAACVQRLREEGAEAIITVGFCFGGAQSFLQAAAGHGLAGVVGFYGPPVAVREGMASPVDRVRDFACPVLGLFAGDDHAIQPEHVTAFEEALTEAGVEHELITYPGTPHSFFDRTQDQYREASEDAWKRVLGFIGGAVAVA